MINATLLIAHDATDADDNDETVDISALVIAALVKTWPNLVVWETNEDQTTIHFNMEKLS